MPLTSVTHIETLDLRFAPRRWAFADERRTEIDAHFATLVARSPVLFNGRVLLMHEHQIDGDTLRGAYFETDFASFVAWRDWGAPDPSVTNCFALGMLRGSDGAYVLGVMGRHTANAGRIYFPGGTPEPADIIGGHVDLDASVSREVVEETGLTTADLDVASGWSAVVAPPRIALLKTMWARVPAAVLARRIEGHIAREAQPELAGVHIVRGLDDLHPRMQPFVTTFFRHLWSDSLARQSETKGAA